MLINFYWRVLHYEYKFAVSTALLLVAISCILYSFFVLVYGYCSTHIDTRLSILIGLLVTSLCLLLASSLKTFNFIL